jgi:DNA-binding response OmpR family regulator
MVLHKGREIPLQRRQFIFALKMFQSLGSVVTRDYLARCFGERLEMGSRSLDGCAATIRKKLELREENGLILRAVYRHGYQLVSLGTSHRTDVYA